MQYLQDRHLPSQKEQIWIPWDNWSDIGADQQLINYDLDSSDEFNKEMSSHTLGGHFDLYSKFIGSLSTSQR